MSMIQKIEIDGKQVPFKASAAIPRIYRIKFHRDIYKDLDALGKAVGNGDAENSRLDMFSLEMFENIAYVMAKHADPSIPDSPEEWLDEFSTFSIYQVLPKIIELWGINVQTDVSSKKKLRPTDRKMTTPLFLLRCVQLGISIRDLDLLTIGMVNDMYAESGNDEYKGYSQMATQKDFDAFQQKIYSLYNDNVLTQTEFLHILYLNGGVLYGNNKFEYQNR